jgi:3-oxoacyl-[acyl-carrier protein] reductase
MIEPAPPAVQGVALVTGSGRNIGRAIALELAAAGHDVVVNVRSNRDEGESVAGEVRERGRRALVAIADVRQPDDVRTMFAEAHSALGPVTVLVNNAAVRTEMAIEELVLEEWRRVIGIVLDGAYLCSQAAVAQMREVGWGRIVNVIGMSGEAGASHRAHVVAAKSGLIGLTRALAVELGPDGITVNGVSPGVMDTVRNTASAPAEPKHHSGRVVPLGRRGVPADIAGAVRFLASPAAAYITGEILKVNGGAYLA